jgi:hypothetical protein
MTFNNGCGLLTPTAFRSSERAMVPGAANAVTSGCTTAYSPAMAQLSFEGETHNEIVAKVKRWLRSVDGEEDVPLGAADAINASAELTKDALRVIASAAPGPVGQSDLMKGLTALGYQATDATSKAMIDALDAVSKVTNGGVVQRVREAQAAAAWEMSQTMAKQILKGMTGGRSKSGKPTK